MSEPTKQQMGDGQDNYGQAAKQARNAAKNIGKNFTKEAGQTVAKQAAAKGAEATVNAAASTVKAGVEGGKAIAEIAAGTASGGHWGAIISAAWALRHTLFKILICICLVLVLIVAVIVSLPDIVMQNIKDMFTPDQQVEVSAVNASYNDLADSVEYTMEDAYEKAREKAEKILTDSKYDTELSRQYFEDNAKNSLDYNVAYILSAYSVSMEQTGTSKAHLLNKLDSVSDQLFTVESTEKTKDVSITVDGKVQTVTVTYVVVTINRYDEEAILKAFGLNPDATYKNYGLTNREYVEYMAKALKLTIGE